MSNRNKQILLIAFAAAITGAVYEAILIRRQQDLIGRLQHDADRVRDANGRASNQRDQALLLISGQTPIPGSATLPTPESRVDSVEMQWLENGRRLREMAAAMPDRVIPELGLLRDDDWLLAARNLDLNLPEEVRKALSMLRSKAKMTLGSALQDALREYAAAHEGRLPTDANQLGPYFTPPAPQGALQRYEMTQSGTLDALPSSAWLIAEKVPVDDQYDTRQTIGMMGLAQSVTTRPIFLTTRAIAAFSRANSGRSPTDSQDLQPYLEAPLDPMELQAVFQAWQSNPGTLGLGITRMSYRQLNAR